MGIAAVAHYLRGNALADGTFRRRIQENRRIGMAVGVNKPGADYFPRGVNTQVRIGAIKIPDLDNPVALDADICKTARVSGSVNNPAVFNQYIQFL
jgi:hypothetical protein